MSLEHSTVKASQESKVEDLFSMAGHLFHIAKAARSPNWMTSVVDLIVLPRIICLTVIHARIRSRVATLQAAIDDDLHRLGEMLQGLPKEAPTAETLRLAACSLRSSFFAGLSDLQVEWDHAQQSPVSYVVLGKRQAS